MIESPGANAGAGKILGTWQGAIDAGHGMKLPLVFTFVKNPHNELTASMQSPAQSAKIYAIESVSCSAAGQVKADLTALKATLEGTVSAEQIVGTFTQGGIAFDITLKKTAAYEPPRRKQDPVKPYPYREEEVVMPSRAGHLSGTLTLPDGGGAGAKYPVVVLIAGSGPQDRNEQIFFHKPFLIIADYLTRHGIAVLRYDKRGLGGSTGSYMHATTLDFADDAQAAIDYLKTRTDIDSKHIGLIGHSEGGVVAPIVASRDTDVSFIVSLAGSAFTGEKILLSQTEILGKAAGLPDALVKESVKQAATVYAIVKVEPDDDKALARLKEIVADKDKLSSLEAILKPWYRCFMTLDPVLYWEKVKCPVLAVNGDKDMQVTADDNLAAIRKALQVAGDNNVTIEKIDGVNHLFQTLPAGKTGAPSEYADIEETFAPAVLEKMQRWIAGIVGG